MTLLMIGFGISGMPELAADIGIVHGATLALFYAFSGNVRSMVLNRDKAISIASILVGRLLLVLPLSVISFYLVVSASSVEIILAIILVARRAFEWLSEVYLSDIELSNNEAMSNNYIIVQAILLTLTFIAGLNSSVYFMYMLGVWALSPLVYCVRYILKNTYVKLTMSETWLQLVPHIGSTAIIGITVYIFRLLIILFTNKAMAGDLFTAFAIGGLLGSVFANGIGPAIAKHESDSKKGYLPSFLKLSLAVVFLLAIGLLTVSILLPDGLLQLTGKSSSFWLATSLSLVGGVIMVFAQRIRFRCLQHDTDHDLFGPDVLINLLIVLLIPFIFYTVGPNGLVILYLGSAIINLLFYMSSYREYGKSNRAHFLGINVSSWKVIISFLLLFPIFIQISSGIFVSDLIDYKSSGLLRTLPLPIAIGACFYGILLLGRYRKAYKGSVLIFISFIAMVTAILLGDLSSDEDVRFRFLLLLQYILPMFGLILGEMYGNDSDAEYSKGFLYVLIILVPAQLFLTFSADSIRLITNVYYFSVYQNYQYVVVVLVSAYLISFATLLENNRYRLLLLTLWPLLGLYVIAVLSKLAIILFLSASILMLVYKFRAFRGGIGVLVFVIPIIYISTFNEKNLIYDSLNYITGAAGKSLVEIDSIAQRLDYWSFYFNGIIEGAKEFLVGHDKILNRGSYPSAHNYYLGFWYNFGLLSLVPVLLLILFTLIRIIKGRKDILGSFEILVLVSVVMFLLFFDNFFKVGLRQPYSGIFSFFVWGLLLAKLSTLRTNKFIPDERML